MFFPLISVLAAGVAAAPYPLVNGFPNLNATALQQVFKLAGGTLPNGPLPTNISANGTQTLQLIAANELFEVAFFDELLMNITSQVEGYTNVDPLTVESLIAVLNQEQVHVLAANGVLQSAGKTTIQPCKYNFPVSTFDDAITLAQTFTDVVLGTLPVAQSIFAADGGQEPALVPIVGSIIGQEGEQNGFYRILQKKVASAAPMLTGGAPQFAFSAISQFIVPGSCPNLNAIGLTAFPALNVESTPKAFNSTALFSVNGTINASNSTMVYISGQNLPFSVPVSNSSVTINGQTFFFAPFPFDAGFSRGLTIGAVVAGANAKFNTTAQVANATLFGPALIEVN